MYDIVDNKRRSQLVKYLQGYGFRVQKSCFEVILNKSVFKKLKMEIAQYATDEDSIRIYQLHGIGRYCSHTTIPVYIKSLRGRNSGAFAVL
ncbi:MAG: CRISPR-associated endonuclease Cas2 [Blautia wexlerae]